MTSLRELIATLETDEPFLTGAVDQLLGVDAARGEHLGRIQHLASVMLARCLTNTDPGGHVVAPGSLGESRWSSDAPEIARLNALMKAPRVASCFPHTTAIGTSDGWSGIAKLLVTLYRELEEALARIEPSTWAAEIAIASLERDRYSEAPRRVVLDVVDRLRTRPDLFELTAVHGSYATLDERPGVSDVDLAVVLTREATRSADALLEARRECVALWPLLQQVDPLQHHGPYVYTHADLNFYPQTALPLAVWREARVAGDQSSRIAFKCRSTALARALQLRSAAAFYRKPVPTGLFDLKLHLQVVLLAPVFAAQRHGTFVYKRDAFEPFFAAAPEPAQRAVAKASRARSENWYADDVERLQPAYDTLAWEGAPEPLASALRQRVANIAVRGRLATWGDTDASALLSVLADYMDSLVDEARLDTSDEERRATPGLIAS